MRKIILALPGDGFSSFWVTYILQLQAYLLKEGLEVGAMFSYTNNIYITRHIMGKTLEDGIRAGQIASDTLVLWIDDDNPLAVPQLVQLLDDLEAHPEADLVSGWYWIAGDVVEGGRVCAGTFRDGGDWSTESIKHADLVKDSRLRPIEWAGFGCLLMRLSALEKAGPNPFRPILVESDLGFTGDDISFFARLHAAGGVSLLDPVVHVPHLKLRAVSPPRVIPALEDNPKAAAA